MSLVVFSATISLAEDLTGRWYITAGNTKYIMELTQRGIEVHGNMIPVNDNINMPIIVYGTINGTKIKLAASNRDITITLQMDGVISGEGSSCTIHGSLKKNNRHNFKFIGIRH